jgi:flagellar secretion chaperone FliS
MNPYQAYSDANNNIDEENKPRLLLKVYESMLDRIDIAKTAIKKQDFKKKYEELTKLTTVLEVLDSSLDFSQGDQIAKNLSDLYQYVVRQLLAVHVNNDLQILDECRALLVRLNEGFTEAYRRETGRRQESIRVAKGVVADSNGRMASVI